MKHLKNKISILGTFIYLLSLTVSGISQSTYFEDPVIVPVFEGTVSNNTTKDIYWDLSEINNVNNRLDLAAGVTQRGETAPNIYHYTNGNWYYNQVNSNFNGEDQDDRFIYQHENSVNGITGLIFAKLNNNPSIKKEVLATREDNKIYVFKNEDGTIVQSNPQSFIVNGKVVATGKFTNDTLNDVAVISGSDLKIYKNLGNSTLDSTPVYTLHNVNAEKVIIAQVNNYVYPYSIIHNTASDREEIIIKSSNTIKIYKNNNSNGISDSTTISISSTYAADFKLNDIDNDGLNDLEVSGLFEGIKIFKNISGTISSTASYTNTNYPVLSTVASGDFNKDGWNDVLVSNFSHIYLFLNSSGSFSQTASDSEEYYDPLYAFVGRKLEVTDLHNKGGLSVLSSINYLDIEDLNIEDFDPELIGHLEEIVRFNPADTDAVPSPAYLFESYVQYHDNIYHPKLLLFDRGNRDFLKYKIYKKNWVTYHYYLFDSTTATEYIDTTE